MCSSTCICQLDSTDSGHTMSVPQGPSASGGAAGGSAAAAAASRPFLGFLAEPLPEAARLPLAWALLAGVAGAAASPWLSLCESPAQPRDCCQALEHTSGLRSGGWQILLISALRRPVTHPYPSLPPLRSGSQKHCIIDSLPKMQRTSSSMSRARGRSNDS